MNRFLAFFDRPQMTWWDVIDILIVSLLIYEGLKLIRGTRAVQMAAGSLLILLLFYVSQLFPLQTVAWLIRSVLVYVVFAAIVLFQTDIRRGLSQLGSAPLFRYLGRAERAAETVEEVSAAAGMLSKRSIGALMVIEREIGLRNYVESGIPLDAEVSYDLLTTIFQPSGPMHDGAVIIQEDRIAAAACFLPLTVNPGLDRDLGTRHRAAIGLTEECDAVAVVVSEERGEISMAIRGRLHRRLSVEDLRERLKAVMVHKRWRMGDVTPAGGLALMAWHPFRNLGLKVVALLLGALLWMTVSGQQAERRISGVPVVYRNKPAGLEITEQTSVVDIHVRGLDGQLRTVLPRDFEARVDLTSGHAGAQSFRIRTDQVTSPLGVEVTQVDPGEILTVLEEAGTSTVPVLPLIDGTPAPGYVISEMHVEPPTVTIIGPQRRVAGAASATTDRVSIQGASSTVTQNVSVGVPDAVLRLRDSTTARVTVRIEQAGERTFPNARVTVRNIEPGLRAEPTPGIVSVQMRGAEPLLARLDPAAVVAYVDVTGLGRGMHEVPVLVDPRGTLTVTSVRPAQITVNIR